MTLRIIDTPLGGTPLALSAMAGTTPAEWYQRMPGTPGEWTARARAIAASFGSWVGPVAPAFGPGGAKLLERVDGGRGIVVTAGQQAGLFAGPMYTWIKALGALELAARIEQETGVPAVPVFWAATDDADFTEASTTVVSGATGPERLTLHTRPPDGVPTSHAAIGPEIDELRARLRAACGDVRDGRALSAADRFQKGTMLGAAYVAMLRDLLEPLGIAVFDAAHDAAGAASRSIMTSALARAKDVHDALRVRADEIRAGGYSVAVDTARSLSLAFAWDVGPDGLPRKRRLTLEDARSGVNNVRLSPNVLLRPVVERAIMPTVAYLAGPGEIAYFAQVSAVAHALGAATPLALPRWSGMAISSDIDAVLGELGLHIEDLRDPHAAEGALARAALPRAVHDALADMHAAIDRNVPRLDGAISAATIAGAKVQLDRRLERIERRIVAASKHREAPTLKRVAYARGALFPFGKPQERALNIVPLWSEFGDSLVNGVRAACATYAARLVGRSTVPA